MSGPSSVIDFRPDLAQSAARTRAGASRRATAHRRRCRCVMKSGPQRTAMGKPDGENEIDAPLQRDRPLLARAERRRRPVERRAGTRASRSWQGGTALAPGPLRRRCDACPHSPAELRVTFRMGLGSMQLPEMGRVLGKVAGLDGRRLQAIMARPGADARGRAKLASSCVSTCPFCCVFACWRRRSAAAPSAAGCGTTARTPAAPTRRAARTP